MTQSPAVKVEEDVRLDGGEKRRNFQGNIKQY